jgi:tRNA nucleotidyltransferase (CCA-adding enzyme)
MNKHDDIETKILKKINPTENDRKNLKSAINNLKISINDYIKNNDLPIKIELVGSTAKDTYLRENLDIDIFLLFPKSYNKKELENISLLIGRKLLKDYEESYAEHPYIRGYYKKYKVEIVPCYDIKNASQKLSAVDRTPFHTEYIKKKISNKQKNEVRLLKQFLIGINCYGAEADIEGFSGYLCEILILKFGTFRNLINEASNWNVGIELTLTRNSKNKFKTPMTFIDPIDEERNVSSALSKNKFNNFIFACKNYIKKPSVYFFFPNKIIPWSLNKIKNEVKKQNAFFIGIVFPKPDVIIENLYPQIRKAAKSINISAKKYGFKINNINYYLSEYKKIYIIIKLESKSISNFLIHYGPPLNHKKNVDEFISKWEDNPKTLKKPYINNNRIYVNIKRDYITIKDFLINNIDNLSLGKHLDKINLTKIKFIENEELIIEDLRIFWTNYLDGKMPWER